MRGSFEHAYQLLTSYFTEVRLVDPNFVFDIHTLSSKDKRFTRIRDSQARLTPWAMDNCESRKFVADSLTCRVRTSRHHFQMTSYSITNSVNIEDGTCSCRWWQTMGIPYEHGV
ncbi:hypothetical protein GIB67_002449, partial [Kingdonia uniflora]